MRQEIILGGFLILLLGLLIGCETESKKVGCGGCHGEGPFLSIDLNPPVKESIELELKLDTQTVKKKCFFVPTSQRGEPVKEVVNMQTIEGTCSGLFEEIVPTTPSSSPTKPPTKYNDSKPININQFLFRRVGHSKQVAVTLRNLNGDVLGKQNFDLKTEPDAVCGKKYPNCISNAITLHLSKPTEPTPTPSSTPSP
ncbi:MAG: hypothetical protein IV090_08065 [Candidatus Sericytochromatia bacterium]|nr:hypothetical protein [Candidatus Sericytochromatia bacterium]